MVRVYVAGAYSAPTPREVEANVWRAIEAGHQLMDLGLHPLVPHLSHYSEARRSRPYEQWMALDLAWLRAAEVVLRLPGPSSGADREVALARELGIPVFASVAEVAAWAKRSRAGQPEHVSVVVERALAKVRAKAIFDGVAEVSAARIAESRGMTAEERAEIEAQRTKAGEG